jgi:hypothetical protein
MRGIPGTNFVRGAIICALSISPISWPSAAEGQKVVSWTEETVQVSLQTGVLATVRASFTSAATMEDVELRLVPELEPFIVVQPNTFAILQSGTIVPVTLSFLVPDGTGLGTYEGTLHLTSGNRTLPATLKIAVRVTGSATSDWETVVGRGGEYQVKRPADWSSAQLPNGVLQLLAPTSSPSDGLPDAVISIVPIHNGAVADAASFIAQANEEGQRTEGLSEFGYPVTDLSSGLMIPVNGMTGLKLRSADGFSEDEVYVPTAIGLIALDSLKRRESVDVNEVLIGVLSTLRF